ncbi:hypothetical protein AB0M68_28020 [Streptomyces sp. NPDC051453]|uniref:hypothetical protein n=1 Tax=Streptomyces sp. NPDC051453 TaxID=3154941 RepID=UPI0034366807
MASVLGLVEAKEASARERAERLRSELEDAEREVERLVTAREMVSQVLSQTQETGSHMHGPGEFRPVIATAVRVAEPVGIRP